jgi:hypothetical protein
MASRVVRDGINDSPRMDALIEDEGWLGDSFFRRLLHIADDFGIFDARVSVIRAHCFPTQLEKVREADVSRLLANCEKAGLVRLYTKRGLKYGQIRDFRQRVRAMKSKYPPPDDDLPVKCPSDDGQTTASLISSQTIPSQTIARAQGDARGNGKPPPTKTPVKPTTRAAPVPKPHASQRELSEKRINAIFDEGIP